MVLTATGQHLAKRARILPRAKFGYKVPTLHLAPLLQPGELLLTLSRAQGIKPRQGLGARAVEALPVLTRMLLPSRCWFSATSASK